MHEKAPDKRNELLRLSDETEAATDKNLRLKGMFTGDIGIYYIKLRIHLINLTN